ncbi:uridine kinase [Natronospirillum operosum]|uniref:Uridine kinase n=1 Tax=Natronospirillum operosum TaxID=2759953 RepID=A0A4Z0WB08_9GAMM|nr:uridine kinase [Natronospirillum operosum]TGG90713.1 uridine kinase [Natronospirillum operosum]
MSNLKSNIETVVDMISTVAKPGKRTMVAVAGPPGSGKSTLSEALVERLRAGSEPTLGKAAVLPMDGFHLDVEELKPLGLVSRRGAPNTFDPQGFLDLLKAARKYSGDVRYPIFDRVQDRAIPDAGVLCEETEIVVAEGNYLLLDAPVWRKMKPLFDLTVFLETPIATLEQRLMDRWLNLGFSSEKAREKVYGNDLINARLVMLESTSADIRLNEETLV